MVMPVGSSNENATFESGRNQMLQQLLGIKIVIDTWLNINDK